MAERFTADLLFILFVLLIAALLGFLIGWFLAKGRCKKRIAELELEIEGLRVKLRKLEEEKNGLEAKLRLLEDEKNRFDARLSLLENEKNSLMAHITDQEEDEQALRGEATRLDTEVDHLQILVGKLEKEIATLRLQLNEAPKTHNVHGIADVPPADVIPEFTPERIKLDDLKEVIGIGPKIAQLLLNRGITTWKALSEASPGYLTKILIEDGGERYRIHNPETWPHQALLLHEGRWDEFRVLRDRLWIENR